MPFLRGLGVWVGKAQIPFSVDRIDLGRSSSVIEERLREKEDQIETNSSPVTPGDKAPPGFKHIAELFLPDVDVRVFGCFAGWLSSGELTLPSFNAPDGGRRLFFFLAEMYVFADQYDMLALKHAIIRELFRINRDHPYTTRTSGPGIETIFYIYTHSKPESAFRELMIAWLFWHTDGAWFYEEKTEKVLSTNLGLLAELDAARSKRLRNLPSPFKGSPEERFEDRDDFLEWRQEKRAARQPFLCKNPFR